ncbi:uncharacterized protein LOC126203933 [Schistocerca nitens]|uniref:uncharacterized protein LOC126203933 n=1 Tax=Schistocerca nitens TaxID=7011 RepID=UPI002117BC7C|nr:uncharacterized protein LOC126203933 [Schistocerca nitens]
MKFSVAAFLAAVAVSSASVVELEPAPSHFGHGKVPLVVEPLPDPEGPEQVPVAVPLPGKPPLLAPPCCPPFRAPECCPLICPDYFKPICTTDCKKHRTFGNECLMHLANCQEGTRYRKIYDGKCARPHPIIPYYDKAIEWW